jgi:hypothetical protein
MKRDYLIDHRHLFLFGYIFYLFTPYWIGTTEVFSGLPGIELYRTFFHAIPENKLDSYLLITLSWLPAFYFGHFFCRLLFPSVIHLHKFTATPVSKTTNWVAPLLIFALLIFSYFGRNSIFGGYDSYDISARGKMSTLLVIFNFFLVYQMISLQKTSKLLLIGTLACCILLLSMGGRMYVFQTLIALLIYKTSFSQKKWNAYQILLFFFTGFLIGGIFGLWRMGSSIGIEKLFYSFFAEPAFTWFSTSSFLISNDIPYFNVPLNFMTSFLNLIPNTIISLKPYIVSTSAMVENYQNPLGADSVWSSFVINFGSVGSFFFIFVSGFMLNFLRNLSMRNRFWAVYYILVCSMLPFQFFRDGFYILHKQLYFNFLLLPAIILASIKLYINLSFLWARKQGNIKNQPSDFKLDFENVR